MKKLPVINEPMILDEELKLKYEKLTPENKTKFIKKYYELLTEQKESVTQ